MVFNLSRMAHSGDTISLDLLYEVDRVSCRPPLKRKPLMVFSIPHFGEFEAPGTSIPAKISAAQHLVFTVTGVAQRAPQITIGGLAIENFDQNLEAHACPGLFCLRRSADIDAPAADLTLPGHGGPAWLPVYLPHDIWYSTS